MSRAWRRYTRLVQDRRARADDRGAYAILFALLIVVLVGVVAFALDLALVRESRASTRSAADSAAVAATAYLKDGRITESSPRLACLAAWTYLRNGLSDLGDGSASCASTFAASYTTCPATSSTADWSGGGYQVRITWPVPNNSSLMTNPDTMPAAPTQGINNTVDGVDPCARMGVEVFRDNQLALGGVFGLTEATTRAASVARSIVSGQLSGKIAALNILETTDCNALTTDGGSVVNVGTVAKPGNISVDSDGRGSCTGNGHTIAPTNATGNGIFVIGAGGSISSYAQGPTGIAANSYDVSLVPSRLNPAPISQSVRVTRSPVDQFYNCSSSNPPASPAPPGSWTYASSCQEGGGFYIWNQVEVPYGSMNATTALAAGFTVVPSSSCNVNSTTVYTATQIYFDCANLNIKAPLILANATTIVAKGNVDVSTAGSCLVVNVPNYKTALAGCPTTLAQVNGGTPTSDALLVIQNGNISKGGPSIVALRNTMTYLRRGYTDFSGTSGGLLYMTMPEGLGCGTTDSATDKTCRYGKFWKLTLWSEFATNGTSQTFKYAGGTEMQLKGVLFSPAGNSVLVGSSANNQATAQFWTKTLRVTGGATVTMDVDKNAGIEQPSYGGTLIR